MVSQSLATVNSSTSIPELPSSTDAVYDKKYGSRTAVKLEYWQNAFQESHLRLTTTE